MDVKIYPMNTGFIGLDKGAYITPGKGYGQDVVVPTWTFLVTGGTEKILVDTGMSATERADWHHRGSYQPEGFRIDEQLAKLGVGVEEIGGCSLHPSPLGPLSQHEALYERSVLCPREGACICPGSPHPVFQVV